MKMTKYVLMSLIAIMALGACSSNKGTVYGKKKKGISQPANGRMQGIN